MSAYIRLRSANTHITLLCDDYKAKLAKALNDT